MIELNVQVNHHFIIEKIEGLVGLPFISSKQRLTAKNEGASWTAVWVYYRQFENA